MIQPYVDGINFNFLESDALLLKFAARNHHKDRQDVNSKSYICSQECKRL